MKFVIDTAFGRIDYGVCPLEGSNKRLAFCRTPHYYPEGFSIVKGTRLVRPRFFPAGSIAVFRRSQVLFVLYPGIYEACRSLMHAARYYSGQGGDREECGRIAERIARINSSLRAWNHLTDYEKRKIDDALSDIRWDLEAKTAELKVEARELIWWGHDSQGRPNPGALIAKNIAAKRKMLKRAQETVKIESAVHLDLIRLAQEKLKMEVIFLELERRLAGLIFHLKHYLGLEEPERQKGAMEVRAELLSLYNQMRRVCLSPFYRNARLSEAELEMASVFLDSSEHQLALSTLQKVHQGAHLKNLQPQIEEALARLIGLRREQCRSGRLFGMDRGVEEPYHQIKAVLVRLAEAQTGLLDIQQKDAAAFYLVKACKLMERGEVILASNQMKAASRLL